MADLTLRERKQQRARDQIIDAAYALFAERGFAHVTVTDIAERAEVGRTTFFRYFGDKQEPIFADEQQLLESIAAAPPVPPPATLAEAISQVWGIVPTLAPLLIGDPARYADRERLLAGNPELQDRAGRKMRKMAGAVEQLLVGRGADPELALLTAQLVLACFQTARQLAGGDVTALMPHLRRAVETLTTSLEGP
jgi:AcrR family transcriptional regulator